VLYKLSLTDAVWLKLLDVPAYPTNRVTGITNSISGVGNSFYRLVTPAQP
jgi:hypothetical protein